MNKQKNILLKIAIATTIVIALSIFLNYQNKHLVVSEYSYTSSKVPEEMNGYCIVQISDLHNAVFGHQNHSLLDKISALNPDIIVITGDIIDGSTHTNLNKTTDFIEQVVEISPVYYITGNHEYYIDDSTRSLLFETLENNGVTIMSDMSLEIYEGVYLIGLDDNSLNINKLNTLTDENNLNLVLAHEPQYFRKYITAGADLIFAGHAHGGQFILPFIGAVYAPDQGINPAYTEGIYEADNTQMIVSRGLGNSVFPFRIFNYPEIVCVKFYAG